MNWVCCREGAGIKDMTAEIPTGAKIVRRTWFRKHNTSRVSVRNSYCLSTLGLTSLPSDAEARNWPSGDNATPD